MNIFVLDRNPVLSAQFHCDTHVVKMCLESAQILCTALHKQEVNPDLVPYRKTHTNHPCCRWASFSIDNFYQLCERGLELCREYTYRYDETHKCEGVINTCQYLARTQISDKSTFYTNNSSRHPQAMPEEYKDSDVVWAYRQYYINEKSDIATWNKTRKKPIWWPH